MNQPRRTSPLQYMVLLSVAASIPVVLLTTFSETLELNSSAGDSEALGTPRIDMRSVEVELEFVRAELLARTVAQ